ncbi:MAG: TRAP transporter large permease [bacterium]
MNLAPFVLFGSFAVLLLLRVPVAFSLGASSFIAVVYVGLDPMVVVQKMADGMDSFALLAIPFFILAGNLMTEGGIAARMIDLANVLVGFIRGGLAMVNIVASMFFGGISGSSVADTSSIGTILIPMMKRKGYDADYSVSVTITSSTQGIIIPPSHNAIIYALAAGGSVSIARLFLGGIIPGVMVGLALMVVSCLIAARRNYPRGEMVPLREALKILAGSFPGLLTAVIIVGLVIFGVATATESSAIAVVYAFLIAFFFYREIPLGRLSGILLNSVKTISMVMLLIAAASSFGFVLAYLRIPALVTEALLHTAKSPFAVLLMINVLLLALGCVMDMAPLILIVTPVLLPVVTKIGMDPVHFGIVLLLNLGIGLCTPPVGTTLFVGCAIGGISIEKTTRALPPFYLAMVSVLLLVTYVPWFTMFLPGIFMK